LKQIVAGVEEQARTDFAAAGGISGGGGASGSGGAGGSGGASSYTYTRSHQTTTGGQGMLLMKNLHSSVTCCLLFEVHIRDCLV